MPGDPPGRGAGPIQLSSGVSGKVHLFRSGAVYPLSAQSWTVKTTANKKGLHLCNHLIFPAKMAPFVDAYRTLCIAPGPNARVTFEEAAYLLLTTELRSLKRTLKWPRFFAPVRRSADGLIYKRWHTEKV
jgi:hypothetical protein